MTIIDILHDSNCAHNVVIVTGNDESKMNQTRFYIFPRIHANTAIVSQCVDPACVELSGQFPCKDENEWKKLTGQSAVDLIKTVKIEEKLMLEIKTEIKSRILLI